MAKSRARSTAWREQLPRVVGHYHASNGSLEASICHVADAMEADEQAREQAREEVEIATALVSRIGEGDKAAETELVRRYQERLRHVLLNQMANRDHVEDVLQNTFIAVIVRLRERAIDDPGHLGGFIYGVAKNVRRGDDRDQIKHQHEPELEPFLRDESLGPEQQASSTETTRIVRQLISQLGEERDRQVLNRLYVLEQDKQVICDELGIDRAHLRRVLHRAKRRLEILFLEVEQARRLNLIPEE